MEIVNNLNYPIYQTFGVSTYPPRQWIFSTGDGYLSTNENKKMENRKTFKVKVVSHFEKVYDVYARDEEEVKELIKQNNIGKYRQISETHDVGDITVVTE